MIGSVNVSGGADMMRIKNRVTAVENRLQTGQTAGLPVFTGAGGAICAKPIHDARDALLIADALRFKAGTYEGTGGDVTLSFDFKPYMVFIMGVCSVSGQATHVESMLMHGQTGVIASYSGNAGTTSVSAAWQERSVTLSWVYEDAHLEHALGQSGVVYSYMAVGA
ncbi:MAG: hypothetical protein II705_03550 [Clostridia bacterium]|nr:hypothetical protein [Clostridia bacterium]